MLHYVFVYRGGRIICRLYKLTLSDQSPFIFVTDSKLYFFGGGCISTKITHKNVSRSALAGRARKKISHRGPNPLSAALLSPDDFISRAYDLTEWKSLLITMPYKVIPPRNYITIRVVNINYLFYI